MSSSSPAAIIALARAGAIDEALRRFAAADASPDDVAMLIVKGRLLKDLALRSSAQERQLLYREAAAAYRRSAELQPATYPLINAATLAALGGSVDEAESLALEVLGSIDAHPDEPETPYYRAATRAEALLLLNRHDEARAAFAEAIALAPKAWEDHATTLRQFRLVLTAQGRDASWLDAHRPPRSLHFGGHMSFDSDAVGRKDLDREILALLEEERIGFGYGALAAGADILIAEALLARGAQLHAVLPGGAAAFASVSVDPFGAAWRRRFDALVDQAETVRAVRPFGSPPGTVTIGLADEIAMGAAVLNARQLESEATQLLVVAGDDAAASGASATLQAQDIWAASNRRQRIVQAPRETAGASQVAETLEAEARAALAVIAIMPAQSAKADTIERWLATVGEAITRVSVPVVAPYLSGERVLLAHKNLQDAADLILALARDGHRVGGDFCAVVPFEDPFSNALRLPAEATSPAEAAAASTPAGSACVTQDFAAALAARGSDGVRADYVGELEPHAAEPPIGLYALK